MFQYPVVGNPWQPSAEVQDLSPDCAKNVQRLLLKHQDECWTNWRLLREPIIGFGTEPSQKASVPLIGKYGLLVFAENSISIKK
jgi:hypothetical protein